MKAAVAWVIVTGWIRKRLGVAMGERVVCIVQARMGSTRLPGKVMADLGGQPMLARVLRRVGRATTLDAVWLATTEQVIDDPVAELASIMGVPVFRGDEADVLDRYYHTAKQARADVVVRVTADCPLIDPGLIDELVWAFQAAEPPVDFAANCLAQSYPLGLAVEVVRFPVLAMAWQEADKDYLREHVMPFVYLLADRFRLLSLSHDHNLSKLRWTVDTAEDLALVRAVYERLGNDDRFSWLDALRVVTAEPALTEINAHIRQKTLPEG